MINNRIGSARNPVAAGAGDARTTTRAPAGTQGRLEPAHGLGARRPRSSDKEEGSRHVRPRQEPLQIGNAPVIPFGLAGSPDSPGFPSISPRFLEHQPGPAGPGESPRGSIPDGSWFKDALKSYEAAMGLQGAGHSGTDVSVSQSTLRRQVVQGANLTRIDRSLLSRELHVSLPDVQPSPGSPADLQFMAFSREPSPSGFAGQSGPESPPLSAILSEVEATWAHREAAHTGLAASALRAIVHQTFAKEHQWSMRLPVTAGMPPMSFRLEKKTSYQYTIEPSGPPPGGENPVQQVSPGALLRLPPAVSDLAIPAGDKALVAKLTEAQPYDSQVGLKQQKIALLRLANWLHENGREGLENLRTQSPETHQKVVNDFLYGMAARHYDSGPGEARAPQHIVDILLDGLVALQGVQEASASTAVVRSPRQPLSAVEVDRLIRSYFQ